MANNMSQPERLAIILLGAILGTLSLAILFGYYQTQMWLSPVLGIIALVLLSAALVGNTAEREMESA